MAFSNIQGSRGQASSVDRQERRLVNQPRFFGSPNLHSIGVESEKDHMRGGKMLFMLRTFMSETLHKEKKTNLIAGYRIITLKAI